MNDQDVAQLLDAAVARGYISGGQAATLREELFMFPGSNVTSIMVRRGMISPEQAKELEASSPAKAGTVDDDDMDFSFGGNAADSSRILAEPERDLDPDSAFLFQTSTSKPMPASPLPKPPPAPQHNAQTPVRPAASERSPYAPPPRAQSPIIASQSGPPVSMGAGSSNVTGDPELLRLFRLGREQGYSDLHLTVGKPPYFRSLGKLLFLQEAPLTAEVSRRLNLSVLTSEQQQELESRRQIDFSFECRGVGRFRANVYEQRLGIEGAYRLIPVEVPTLESLQLPKVLERLTTYPQGLNLVTGPGGCGKTSTVAAMLEFINAHRHEHIITVEDPVEYVLRPKNCQVTQREVGTHTGSFANALRTALRQDPDVIMIGELRDLETTSISITAAETGHLVFGTLHTSSAARTVARILDVYPPAQRAQICMMVAESLRGIISQQLIQRKDGRGRACAMEILLVTTGVSQVIKEGKTHQLASHMQSGRKLGMISMDDSLMELLQAGVISGNEAYMRAENKAAFELLRGQ